MPLYLIPTSQLPSHPTESRAAQAREHYSRAVAEARRARDEYFTLLETLPTDQNPPRHVHFIRPEQQQAVDFQQSLGRQDASEQQQAREEEAMKYAMDQRADEEAQAAQLDELFQAQDAFARMRAELEAQERRLHEEEEKIFIATQLLLTRLLNGESAESQSAEPSSESAETAPLDLPNAVPIPLTGLRTADVRRAALATINAIDKKFQELRAGFSLPDQLDFVPNATAEDPELSYSSTTAIVHRYEQNLAGLLSSLDCMDTGGFRRVRKARRALVAQIEGALEDLDKDKAVLWQIQHDAGNEPSSEHVSEAEAAETLRPISPGLESETEGKKTQGVRDIRARNAAYASIRTIGKAYKKLKAGFALPDHLDFAPDSSVEDPQLLYSSSTIDVHRYERDLTNLLTALDAVDPAGFEGVRQARRALVDKIEGELEDLDADKAALWQIQYDAGDGPATHKVEKPITPKEPPVVLPSAETVALKPAAMLSPTVSAHA